MRHLPFHQRIRGTRCPGPLRKAPRYSRHGLAGDGIVEPWTRHVAADPPKERALSPVELARNGGHPCVLVPGEQFDIWQAVYSPTAEDGYPQPIFDKRTGAIDHGTAAYWREHYDLDAVMQRGWATLRQRMGERRGGE